MPNDYHNLFLRYQKAGEKLRRAKEKKQLKWWLISWFVIAAAVHLSVLYGN